MNPIPLSRYLGLKAVALALLAISGCHDLSTSMPTPIASSTQNSDAIVRCGVLINGLSDEPLLDQQITVKAGRIAAVEAFDQSSSAPQSPAFINLTDFTCLPGLINTHVHFDGNPEDSVDYSIYARRTADETLQLVLENAKTTLLTGFTTVRHVGAWFPDAVYRARSLIERGEALGPRIQTAGPYLTIPGGGGDLGKGNPWSKAGWNLTEQGKLYRSNQTEADRLMAAAGVKLGAAVPVR